MRTLILFSVGATMGAIFVVIQPAWEWRDVLILAPAIGLLTVITGAMV